MLHEYILIQLVGCHILVGRLDMIIEEKSTIIMSNQDLEHNIFHTPDQDVFSSMRDIDVTELLSGSVSGTNTIPSMISSTAMSITPPGRKSRRLSNSRSPRKYVWDESSAIKHDSDVTVDYSKVLHSLRSCTTSIVPHLHKTMIELCLRKKIRCLEDGFWFDILYGSRAEVTFEPERLDAYDDVHKYWLTQASIWRNEFQWKDYEILDNAKDIIQEEYHYMTDEILARMVESKHKFSRYMIIIL